MNNQECLLTIFLRLQSGAHLSKLRLADAFGVSEKTIHRERKLLLQRNLHMMQNTIHVI